MTVDRSIPFFNTLMKRESLPLPPDAPLPDGVVLRTFQPGYERDWARLHVETGDFASAEEAEAYFRKTYLSKPDELQRRGVFAVKADENRVIGACIAWRDKSKPSVRPSVPDVASVHWLVVDEAFHRQGIARAVMTELLRRYAALGEAPIYLHTQPWSWKAILLYDSLGFRLQKTDTFSDYVNQYDEAVQTLTALSAAHPEALSPEALKTLLSHAE